MPDLVPIRRALLSVSDKTGLVPLAKTLVGHGAEIVSTGGTAAALAEAGIAVTKVEDVTGMAEMMGGRVKTLHPSIVGAVLARRDVAGDLEDLAAHGTKPIDLVCCNLYPFEQTIRREATSAQALEQIDIGGPTMLRSAAKNHPYVTVVTSPQQYDALIEELRCNKGATSLDFRKKLAAAAFLLTAEYDTAITAWMNSWASAPRTLTLSYTHARDLRYGENPHQAAALWLDADTEACSCTVASARVLHGKPLSYNNVQDAAAALDLVVDLDRVGSGRPCAVIIKHTNPCGAALADSPIAAFEAAYEGDPLAAYGGILAFNKAVDEAIANRICDGGRFLEVIVAPLFDDNAVDRLASRWQNVRLLAAGEIRPGNGDEMTYRSIPGAMLVQQRDLAVAQPGQWKHAAGPTPEESMLANAILAWTVVKHLKSNAITIAAETSLLGGGCGQVDRVTACRLAIEKAGEKLREGAVAASDAFFPFPDGPQLLIDAGVKCIVHPGGSKRDQETLDLCDEHGVTCLLTGVRHFRH